MIFKRWFKKKEQTPEILVQPLFEDFYSKKYQDCIGKAEKLLAHSNEEVCWNAKRFIGLSYHKQRHYERAVPIFQEIAKYSNNSDDWFNLITAAIRNGQSDLGEEALERFKAPDVVKGQNPMLTYPNVLLQMMLAYQDIEDYTQSLEKFIVLKRYICQVKQHDADFLSQHGIPFIYQTLVVAQKTLEAKYNQEEIVQFLDNFALHVDDYGKESIAEFRERFQK